MAADTCFECGFTGDCHQHHVIPRSLGGVKTVPLCETCHGKVHDQSFMNHTRLIRAGLKRARVKGMVLGRPVGTGESNGAFLMRHADIVSHLQGNQTIRNVARLTGKSSATVLKVRHLVVPKA